MNGTTNGMIDTQLLEAMAAANHSSRSCFAGSQMHRSLAVVPTLDQSRRPANGRAGERRIV